MGNFGKEKSILTESIGAPTAVVDLGMAIGADGNKITTAGAEVVAIAGDDFTQEDIDLNTANPVTKKTLAGITLGLCRVLLGATVAKGDKGAVDTAAKFRVATAGQAVAVEFREAGVAGDLVEAFKLPQRLRVASTAIADLVHAVGTADGTVADVGGAFSQGTLNDNFKELTTRINGLYALLREQKNLLP